MKNIITILLALSVNLANAQFPASYSNTEPKINTEFPYKKAKIEGNTGELKKSGQYKYFNELNELIRIETYKKGKLISYQIIHPQAYFYDNDNDNNMIEFHRYDVFGFCASSSGNMLGNFGPKDCIDKFIYGSNGKLLEEQYYNDKNQLIEDLYSPAIVKYEYNSNGQLIKKSHFNHERKLMEDIMGLSYTTYTYDSNGNLTETNAYNLKGELSDAFYGASTIKKTYDNKNNMTERRLLKPDGSLAGFDMAGAPKETYKYNNLNQEVYSSGWTSETEMIGCYKMEYNSDGLLKFKMYYNSEDTVSFIDKTENLYVDGKLVGKRTYDKSGNLKTEDYSKIDLKIEGWELIGTLPVLNNLDSYGNIGFVFQLDEQGNVIGYSLINRAGGKSYMDFCQDTLNKLKFKRVGESKNSTGKITFKKI